HFLELINPGSSSNREEVSTGSAYEFSSNRIKNEILSILSDFDLPEEVSQAIRNNSISITELQNIIQECYESAQAIDQRNQDELLASLAPEDLVNQTKVDVALAEIPKIIEAFDHPEFQKIQHAFQEHLKNSQLTGGFFNEQVRENLANFLEQNPDNASLAQQVRLGNASLNELVSGIQNTIPHATSDSIQQLLVSDAFIFLVSNELKKQWLLNPEDVKDKDKIGAFYQKVYNQMKGLSDMMEAISPEFKESPAGSQLTAAQNNINFMQMLNGIFPYIQLPFHANGFSGNGELYVYTKKKELMKNPHQITVLLHLSLEHLGNLDIHISKNGMILENKFFIEDDQSRRFIKKNINLLSEKLNDLGYSVTNEFTKKENKVDLVNDFIAQKEPATAIKRYSFDIRA
ncbi:MAG: flagellar hook-length control protein FliK, partial [Clostridium sp.]|nr:flagellar hook-length control protein FliK [Clostridium sp.]